MNFVRVFPRRGNHPGPPRTFPPSSIQNRCLGGETSWRLDTLPPFAATPPSAEPASFTRPFVPPHANPTPCLPFQLHQHKITALQPALIQELPRSSSVYS